MINGKDEISVAVLKALASGTSLVEVTRTFDLSTDQMKRLKRFYNYIELLEDHADKQVVFLFKNLGLKSLVLAPLFKQADYDGLAMILNSIESTIKRDDLKQLVEKYLEKNKRIAEMIQRQNTLVQAIEQQNQQLMNFEGKLAEKQAEMNEKLAFIEKYPIQAHDFLRKYIGPYFDGQFALRKRLDSGFRRTLTKDHIIELVDYIWVIRDLDELVKRYIKRRTKGHYVEWDIEREQARGTTAVQEEYSAVKSFMGDVEEMERAIEQAQQQLRTKKEEMTGLIAAIERLKKQAVHNFELQSTLSNELTKRELQHHSDLQLKALKWLFGQGGIAVAEFTLPNNKRADIIGYLPDNTIVIIEVKASIQDFRRDHKWHDYLMYSDTLYFCMDFQLDTNGAGLLQPNGQSLKIVESDSLQHEATNRAQLMFAINRALAKKYIYGH